MSTTWGFNFRATASPGGYPADPTNYTYCIGDTFTTNLRTPVGQGSPISFGWYAGTVGSLGTRNRSASEIAQCAGINYFANVAGAGQFGYFLFTLPGGPGSYTVGVALGDATSPEDQYFGLWDGFNNGTDLPITLITSQAGVATSSDNFMDVNGNVYSTGATWLASQTTITHVFTTSTLVVSIGSGAVAASENSSLASLFVTGSGSGPNKAPDFFLGMGAALSPLAWIIERRRRLARTAAEIRAVLRYMEQSGCN